MLFFLNIGAVHSCVMHKSHLSGTLDFSGQTTLMLGACTGDSAGNNFTALGHKVLENVRTFIVEGKALVSAKATELSFRCEFF